MASLQAPCTRPACIYSSRCATAATELVANAARLAAGAVAHRTLHGGDARFLPLSCDARAPLDALWAELHAAGAAAELTAARGAEGPLWPAPHRELTADVVESVLPGAHTLNAQAHAALRCQALHTAFDPDTDSGRRGVARLLSCEGRVASIWLQCPCRRHSIKCDCKSKFVHKQTG